MKKIDRTKIRKLILSGMRDSEVAKKIKCSPITITLIRTRELNLPIGRRLNVKNVKDKEFLFRRNRWKDDKRNAINLLNKYGYILHHGQYSRKFISAIRSYQINLTRNGITNLRRFKYCANGKGSTKYKRNKIGYSSNFIIIYFLTEARFDVLYELFRKFPLLKNKTPFHSIIEPILNEEEVIKGGERNGSYKLINWRNKEYTLSNFLTSYRKSVDLFSTDFLIFCKKMGFEYEEI